MPSRVRSVATGSERASTVRGFSGVRQPTRGGPDERNISLMLQAQHILYTRYATKLAPFKYSGYPLLLKVTALA